MADITGDEEAVPVEGVLCRGRVQIALADGLPRSRTSPSVPYGSGLPASSVMRISMPSGGLPSVSARCSTVSSGAPMVIMGTSVMPYPWVSWTPISRTTAW